MSNLPVFDLAIIGVYLLAMVLVGVYFSRKSQGSEQFTIAGGAIPGWAIGLSIYATFLSSNTFLGVPGKAYGSDWNSFVFSLSMPLSAWVAAKYFVPFYRRSGEVSAYTHLEHRFGPWARTYAVICFLLTQLARMGSIFFGIALAMQALTGISMSVIMIVIGICIVVYTVLGGMEAVIWTEVVQAIIQTIGTIIILYMVVIGIPGGIPEILEIGNQNNKFSLGSFSLDLTAPTFWVILLYGFFINLNNFGMDQNYVQRYHTARTVKDAASSIWLCVWLYLPISLMFFIIGSCLFAYFQVHPELLTVVKEQAAAELLPAQASVEEIAQLAATLQPSDYGDKVMPYFMVNKIPTGLVGLIISAILAAAMSTISSGMNASATVFSEDVYQRYFNKTARDSQKMRVLYIGTAVFGIGGIASGIAMIGAKSILDMWWELSGIFAAGMLGIFLLGLISKRTNSHEAMIAAIIGVLVIVWMSVSKYLPEEYERLKFTLHVNLIIVIGTLTIFLVGVILTRLRPKNADNH